jgi:hypothetical protein
LESVKSQSTYARKAKQQVDANRRRKVEKALTLERLPLIFDGGGKAHRHIRELRQMPGGIAGGNSRPQSDHKNAIRATYREDGLYGPADQEG